MIDELTTLQGKSQTAEGLTADERARATLLVKTIEDSRNRYQVDIATAATPAEQAINAAIQAVAQANGYSLIVDGDLAGYNGSRLFVYVDPVAIPDITEQVIAQMNGQDNLVSERYHPSRLRTNLVSERYASHSLRSIISFQTAVNINKPRI